MGRHREDAVSGAPDEELGRPDQFGDYDTDSTSRIVASSVSRRQVGLAVVVALLGIVLLVVGIITLITPEDPSSASGQDTPAAGAAPSVTTGAAATTTPSTAPTTSAAPQSPAVLPVTVLNNSPDQAAGLATRVAAALEAGGWPIVELLNYDQTQLTASTVFFTPGNAAEEAAAQALVIQFPEISGGAQPRFEGLAGTGLTVAAVGDWLP